MRKLLLYGMAFAMLAFAGAAFAYPTLLGPTGLVLQPTTDVQAAGTFTGAVDFLIAKDKEAGVTDAEAIRLLYGIFPGAELGAAWMPQGDLNTWDVNAKYKLPVSWEGFDLALGADVGAMSQPNLSGSIETNAIYDVNLVTSYPLWEKVLKGELGATLSGRPIVEGTQINTISGVDGFLGLDAMLPADFSVAFDMSTQSRALQQGSIPLGVALRYAPSYINGLTVQVGCENMGAFDDRYNFLAGASYSFGG